MLGAKVVSRRPNFAAGSMISETVLPSALRMRLE